MPIREMLKTKRAYTASSAIIFMAFTPKANVEILSKELEYPKELPRLDMQELKEADGCLVHVEGVMTDIEDVRQVKLKGDGDDEEDLQTATLQGDGVKISIECWGDSAGVLSKYQGGATVRMEYARFKVKPDGTKTLTGTDEMQIKLLEGADHDQVVTRSGGNAPCEDLTRQGAGGRRKEVWEGKAKLISLNMLGATIDEAEPRSLLNTTYEVYGFAVEQMSPLTTEATEWGYSGCSECNKKAGNCQHLGDPVPRFSMQLKVSDATGCVAVKAFSDAVEGILETCDAGQALFKNKDADTDENQQAIVQHLQQGVAFCGRFQFKLEPAFQTRPSKNAVELLCVRVLSPTWSYPEHLEIFREGGEDYGVPYVGLPSVMVSGRNAKVTDADGVMRKVRKIKTALTLEKTKPSLTEDDEGVGLRATWEATTANTSGNALEHAHKAVLTFTMDLKAMTKFLQDLHGGDTIEACLRLISTESPERAMWQVVSYKKISEATELEAIITRMEQTKTMRAHANKIPQTLKTTGTPTKRQKKLEEMSDFSTPRLGVYSPDVDKETMDKTMDKTLDDETLDKK